jgi:hypothetical protein
MSDTYVSPHHKPSPYEAELLIILAEECAEVIQVVSKILRFGAGDTDPNIDDGPTNDRHLSYEVGDIYAVVQLLLRAGIIDADDIYNGQLGKQGKLDRFLQNR